AAEFILTFQRGPWTGQKWHRVLQEEAQEWAATCAGNPLVKHFLPRISQETGIPIADLSDERIRSLLQSANFLKRRGPATISRWDAFHQGWQERRGELALMLLLLIGYGLKAGFLHGTHHLRLGTVAMSAEAPASSGANETLKAATKSAMFRQCKNKVHVVTACLLNEDILTCINSYYATSLPLSNSG
ncbi:mug158, partial [Symbiodinium sp. CCMP2456]